MIKMVSALGIAAAIALGIAGTAEARPYTVFFGRNSDSEQQCRDFANQNSGNCFWSDGNGSWVVTYEGPDNEW
ncbi:hypothetical protein ACFYV7_19905 [Nocardia suismassiliense]|uniref:Uncharacterized protein n=1 Tax=Nocardia suismassiliense TaxID=2077092 RepID=A0ABW6QV05_9NOCA